MPDLRQTERLGRDEIGVSARTLSRIFIHHGVAPSRALGPVNGEVIQASKTNVVRYERDRPGELVHMDVDYVHSLVDDHSRLAYAEVLPD